MTGFTRIGLRLSNSLALAVAMVGGCDLQNPGLIPSADGGGLHGGDVASDSGGSIDSDVQSDAGQDSDGALESNWRCTEDEGSVDAGREASCSCWKNRSGDKGACSAVHPWCCIRGIYQGDDFCECFEVPDVKDCRVRLLDGGVSHTQTVVQACPPPP